MENTIFGLNFLPNRYFCYFIIIINLRQGETTLYLESNGIYNLYLMSLLNGIHTLIIYCLFIFNFQSEFRIYFSVLRDIKEQSVLKVYYSPFYAEKMGVKFTRSNVSLKLHY